MKKVHWNSLCPCQSGKKYRECCWEKDFDWMIDDNKNFFRSTPMSPEVVEIFKKQEEEFKRIYGRNPRGEDPVSFFFPNSEYIENEMAQVMLDAGMKPEFVYAFEKTGFIVTEFNQNLIPNNELEAWENAIDEYYEIIEDDDIEIDTDILEFSKNVIILDDCLNKIIIILERLIYTVGEAKNLKDGSNSEHTYFDFIMLCFTKSLKSLHAVHLLLKENHGQDSLILIRTIYENYLTIGFLLKDPTKINDLVSGKIVKRTGKYKKDRKQNKIIDAETEQTYLAHITIKNMSENCLEELDAEIHKFLYEYLSDFSHPSIFSIESYLNGHKFDVYKSGKEYHGYLYSVYSGVMLLDCLHFIKILDVQFQKDVHRLVTLISGELIENFEILEYEKDENLPKAFIRRLKCLTNKRRAIKNPRAAF